MHRCDECGAETDRRHYCKPCYERSKARLEAWHADYSRRLAEAQQRVDRWQQQATRKGENTTARYARPLGLARRMSDAFGGWRNR